MLLQAALAPPRFPALSSATKIQVGDVRHPKILFYLVIVIEVCRLWTSSTPFSPLGLIFTEPAKPFGGRSG